MNILKTILSAAVLILVLTPSVHAQSTTDVVAGAIFSEIEKRIIREHYGVDPNVVNTDETAPKWSVKDGDDDEDEDRGEKKKGKNKKDKGKGKSKGLPPGLAKRAELPPGLARQLKEKGRLPAGLAKRDLPDDLMAKLAKRPPSQEVTVVDGDVVLADAATGIILDVIKDVVRGGTSGATGGSMVPPQPQDQEAEENLLDAVLKSIFSSGK